MLTVNQAWDRIDDSVRPKSPVRLGLSESLGCVLAEEIIGTADSPPFDKSMMDGYAVHAEDVQGSETVLPVVGDLFAGQVWSTSLPRGSALRIMTGAPIPSGATAVVPVEWTQTVGEGSVQIQPSSSVRVGLNILRQGTSMKAGEVVLTKGSLLRPQELALLAELGETQPLVIPPLTVGILATGDELVEINETPKAGQIRNSNSLMLAAQVQQAGAIPRLLGIARDQVDDLRTKIRAGLECDLLCLSGGVSAGAADLVPEELRSAGVEEVFHKVAVKPGKPVWFGVRRGVARPETGHGEDLEGEWDHPTYVFGLPGNPVSSMVCFELFVKTALRRLRGMSSGRPVLWKGRLTEPFRYRSDRQTWFPAEVFVRGAELLVRPSSWKGSADLRGTVRANCSLVLPAGGGEWSTGEFIDILPWGDSLQR